MWHKLVFNYIENSILRYRKCVGINKNNTLMNKIKDTKDRKYGRKTKMVKPYMKPDLIHNMK